MEFEQQTIRLARGLLRDPEDNYLLLYTKPSHPKYSEVPDLPGGIIEEDELPTRTIIREVFEATKISIGNMAIRYSLTCLSSEKPRILHYFFGVQLPEQPAVCLSDEHSKFAWVSFGQLQERLQKRKPYDKELRTIGSSPIFREAFSS